MDKEIAKMQGRVLEVFADEASRFALAGGTALERYYLHHRFSWDLDFFSPVYGASEIDRLVAAFRKRIDRRLALESELTVAGRAKVRFYSLPVHGASRPLKIDFVEDVLVRAPAVRTVAGVRVYSAKNIYLHKVAAVAGIRAEIDAIGRPVQEGRHEPRDAFDLYMLSKKVLPLSDFLSDVPLPYQKGMIHWYRTFSRHDLKLGLLDMDLYDDAFDSREMIAHLEDEIRLFAQKVVED